MIWLMKRRWNKMLTVGSLFSGIGGIELGLERTGKFKTIWQCEIEPYPSAVLAKHWPDVPNYGDITKVDWDGKQRPDVICGGFPCQDISVAGKGKGIKEGTRSGLWREFARCLRVLRPRYALVENVPMLANRGLNLVLADLAEIGYDAEWQIISAESVGAPHKRERLFLIAYLNSERGDDGNLDRQGGQVLLHEKQEHSEDKQEWDEWKCWLSKNANVPIKLPLQLPEPLICREVYGFSCGLDRIEALGNAVVPACAQVAGERIIKINESFAEE